MDRIGFGVADDTVAIEKLSTHGFGGFREAPDALARLRRHQLIVPGRPPGSEADPRVASGGRRRRPTLRSLHDPHE